VEALVDVWSTLDLPFIKTKIHLLPMRASVRDIRCTYPDLKQAAE
jgi:hypothetical protein